MKDRLLGGFEVPKPPVGHSSQGIGPPKNVMSQVITRNDHHQDTSGYWRVLSRALIETPQMLVTGIFATGIAMNMKVICRI